MIVSTFLYRYTAMVLSVLIIVVKRCAHSRTIGHIFWRYGVHATCLRILFQKLAPVSCIKNLIMQVPGTREFPAPETFKYKHNLPIKLHIVKWVVHGTRNLHELAFKVIVVAAHLQAGCLRCPSCHLTNNVIVLQASGNQMLETNSLVFLLLFILVLENSFLIHHLCILCYSSLMLPVEAAVISLLIKCIN